VVDGLLAATALVHDLTLVTRNARVIADAGVRVLDPWTG
jgi:predicted nucleic acid-binding protein